MRPALIALRHLIGRDPGRRVLRSTTRHIPAYRRPPDPDVACEALGNLIPHAGSQQNERRRLSDKQGPCHFRLEADWEPMGSPLLNQVRAAWFFKKPKQIPMRGVHAFSILDEIYILFKSDVDRFPRITPFAPVCMLRHPRGGLGGCSHRRVNPACSSPTHWRNSIKPLRAIRSSGKLNSHH